MKNELLRELNFRNLLQYDLDEVTRKGAKPKYEPPLKCIGFCTFCEEKGLVPGNSTKPPLLSHGCDTSDYECWLGPLRQHLSSKGGQPCDAPILFLLLEPGGPWPSGEVIEYKDVAKQPPTKHYYWMPHCQPESHWPEGHWRRPEPSERGAYYGDYFAYLMVRHSLVNVYITNLKKCKWSKETTGWESRTDLCVRNYLSREIGHLEPKLAFCFGRKGHREFKRRFDAYQSEYLYHPAAIVAAARHSKTPEEMVEENDKRIRSAIGAA